MLHYKITSNKMGGLLLWNLGKQYYKYSTNHYIPNMGGAERIIT